MPAAFAAAASRTMRGTKLGFITRSACANS
jgi:hypothetical protein